MIGTTVASEVPLLIGQPREIVSIKKLKIIQIVIFIFKNNTNRDIYF